MNILALLATINVLFLIFPPPEKPKVEVPIVSAAKQIEIATPTHIKVTVLKDLEKPAQVEPTKSANIPKKIDTPARATIRVPKNDIYNQVKEAAAKVGWMGAEWSALEWIISHESSWNHLAVNKKSGACSLFQALPCSKIQGDWQDINNQITFGFKYIKARYGSPTGAMKFWQVKGWY